jgi:hypothetical protein
LTFNNTFELENDPAIAAVAGHSGRNRPMYKFDSEQDRVNGVSAFVAAAGLKSTHKGVIRHQGTIAS